VLSFLKPRIFADERGLMISVHPRKSAAEIFFKASVLHCAHGNKENQISHLNSQEGLGFFIDFISREKGCA